MKAPSTMTSALALAAGLAVATQLLGAAAQAATCDVGGIAIGSNVRFITGGHGVEGSIYAQCLNGQPRCSLDNRVRDHHEGEEVACDAATINASRRKLGVYLSDTVQYWPEGVACYNFAASFSGAQQGVFTQAMDEYHTKTGVKFVTLSECAAKFGSNPNVCGGCTQAFQIVNQGGSSDCYATLGYAPSQRMDLNFGPSCFGGDGGFRVAVHELGHVLGLIHEHTHPNRAVVVLRDSLTLSADNYIKETRGLTTAYDANSIMHYSRDTGLCIPLDKTKRYCDIDQTEADGCVEPTSAMCDASADSAFGRASSLSATDVETLAKMYGSGAGTPPATAPTPTPAPTTPSTAPVPVPPAPVPAPSPVQPTTPAPAPVPAPVPVPAPETPPTSQPGNSDQSYNQQNSVNPDEPAPGTGAEGDSANSFVQWQTPPPEAEGEVGGEAIDSNNDVAATVVAAETRGMDLSPRQVAPSTLPAQPQAVQPVQPVQPQAQPVQPVTVAQPQPAAIANPTEPTAPKTKADAPIKPTQPKGKLCQ